MDTKDIQSRKWLLTFNNPEKHGIKRDDLIASLNLLPIKYACMCDEIGNKEKTPHTHVYLVGNSAIRFGRLQNLYNGKAHIEKARGTHIDNYNYITKSGKWKDDPKADTNIPETFFEIGKLPKDKVATEEKKEKLYKLVQAGYSDSEIIEEDKTYIYRLNSIDKIRQTIKEAEYIEKNRDLKVIFVTGDTGTGKTRDIYKKHGAKNLCRITSYKKDGTITFDNYRGEDVLVFEEFAGQVPIADMLNYLDRYPLMLPSRYNDKVACYTTVYLTSNLGLYELYPMEQIEYPKRWAAFLRRIDMVRQYNADGSVEEYTLKTSDKGRTVEQNDG